MDRRRIQVSVEGRTAVFGPGLPEIVVGREPGCFIRPGGPGIGDRHLVSLSAGGPFFLYVKIGLVTGIILAVTVSQISRGRWATDIG